MNEKSLVKTVKEFWDALSKNISKHKGHYLVPLIVSIVKHTKSYFFVSIGYLYITPNNYYIGEMILQISKKDFTIKGVNKQ